MNDKSHQQQYITNIPPEFSNNTELIARSQMLQNISLTSDFQKFIHILNNSISHDQLVSQNDPYAAYFLMKAAVLSGNFILFQDISFNFASSWPGYLVWSAAVQIDMGKHHIAEKLLSNVLSNPIMKNDPEVFLEAHGFMARIYVETGQQEKVFSQIAEIELLAESIKDDNRREVSKLPFLRSLGAAYWIVGQFSKAIQILEDLCEIANKYGEQYYRLRAEYLLANYYLRLGKIEECQKYITKSQERCQILDEIVGQLGTKVAEANLSEHRGNIEGAIKLYDQCLTGWTQVGNDVGILFCSVNLGRLQNIQGDYKGAEVSFLQALSLSKKLGRTSNHIQSLNGLGTSKFYRGQFQEAIKLYESALDVAEQHDNTTEILNVLNNLGSTNEEVGNLFEAANHYERLLNFLDSLPTSERSFWGTTEARALGNLARVQKQRGQFELATSNLLSAMEIRETLRDKVGIARTKFFLGELYYAMDENERALCKLHECVNSCKRLGLSGFPFGEAKLTLSLVYLENSNIIAAKDSLEAADGLALQTESESLKVKVDFAHALIHRRQLDEEQTNNRMFIDKLRQIKKKAQQIKLSEIILWASLLIAEHLLNSDISQAEQEIHGALHLAESNKFTLMVIRCKILAGFLQAAQLNFISAKDQLAMALIIAEENRLKKEIVLVSDSMENVLHSEKNALSIEETLQKESSRSPRAFPEFSLEIIKNFIDECQRTLISLPKSSDLS